MEAPQCIPLSSQVPVPEDSPVQSRDGALHTPGICRMRGPPQPAVPCAWVPEPGSSHPPAVRVSAPPGLPHAGPDPPPVGPPTRLRRNPQLNCIHIRIQMPIKTKPLIKTLTSTFTAMTATNYFRFTMTAIRHSQRQSIRLIKLTRLSKSHQMRLVH